MTVLVCTHRAERVCTTCFPGRFVKKFVFCLYKVIILPGADGCYNVLFIKVERGGIITKAFLSKLYLCMISHIIDISAQHMLYKDLPMHDLTRN